jgi:hypothetical protein
MNIYINIIFLVIFIAIAAFLIGLFFTGLIGGIVLLVSGKHFSQYTRKKVASRICIGVGIFLLALAAGSAGIIINYAVKIFG